MANESWGRMIPPGSLESGAMRRSTRLFADLCGAQFAINRASKSQQTKLTAVYSNVFGNLGLSSGPPQNTIVIGLKVLSDVLHRPFNSSSLTK